MSTPEQDAALAADQRSREAFQAWRAEPFQNGARRSELHDAYEAAEAEAKRLWAIVGPDPLGSQLAKAQAATDAEEGHDADGE